MVLLEEFGMSYLQGDLPKWFYPLWLTVQTVPIFKNSGRCAVRPLGLRTPLLKVFHKQVVSHNLSEVKAYLEPVQLGMSRSGAQKLVFSIRALLNSRPDFICVKIDCRNAYNEQSRRACIDAFSDEPSLRHLAHTTPSIWSGFWPIRGGQTPSAGSRGKALLRRGQFKID